MSLFENRAEGGLVLASALEAYAGRPDVVVLALPRGGVPVGFQVAQALGAPLDLFVVRKLGLPGHEELAVGAVASGGVRVLNKDVVAFLPVVHVTGGDIEAVVAREQRELARMEQAYRRGRPPLDVAGKSCILVDDGLATGATMRAAVQGLRQRRPGRVVVAVPVAAPETCADLAPEVDDIVCALTPRPFRSVGQWYRDFSQTTDEEVRELLDQAARRTRSPLPPG